MKIFKKTVNKKSKVCFYCNCIIPEDSFCYVDVNYNGYYCCISCYENDKLKRFCEVCGTDISDRHGLSKYCETCHEIVFKNQNKKLEEKRPKRNNYYNYYHEFRRKGTSNIGEHLVFRDGVPDFERESKIIRFEKSKILRKGCSQFNPIFGLLNSFLKTDKHCRVAYSYFDEWVKLDTSKVGFDIYSLITFKLPVVCDVCGNGKYIVPTSPLSCDYSYDGFVMPYCDNCGFCFSGVV